MTTRTNLWLALALCASSLTAAAVVTSRFGDERERTAAVEAERLADGALARARDALSAQLEALRLTAHNAGANPRLQAAVRGRVDARTLADLFATEPWWQPYREQVAVALSYEGTALAFRQDRFPALPLVPRLVQAARAGEPPPPEILAGDRGAVAVASTLVRTATAGLPAVLVVARPLSVDLRAAAERAGDAVLLSDGARALEAAGEAPQIERLKRAVGREAQRRVREGAWAAAAHRLTPGLWLWSAADARGFEQQAGADQRSRTQLAWGAALVISALGFLPTIRGRRRQPAPVAPLPGGEEAALATPTPTPGARTVTGTYLGRYKLLDRIGEGGMAEIYTAVTFGMSGFRRNFVVKRLRPEMVSNQEAVSQFVDEANLASTLVHPNIVPVFDFGQAGRDYYIALEYVVGRDLGRLTRRLADRGEPPLSPAAALFVAHEVLAGLEYAHGKKDEDGTPLNIVHRDISPENIMISERGEVKLLDFGIVKAAQGRVTRTDVGLVKGNVDFMAPEQARGRPVDARADLFSVGLVVYFALTQGPLYDGDTLYDRLVRAATGLTEEDIQRLALLPAPLHTLLPRALATDPAVRFPTAAEFRAAVAPYIRGGQEELASALARAFGDDLQLEQDRIAAAVPRRPTREAAPS